MALQHPTQLGPNGLAMPYLEYHAITPAQGPSSPSVQAQQPPAGVSLSAWAAQQRDRYFALEGEARSLAGIENKLAEQQQIVDQFQRAKQRADSHTKEMESILAQAQRRLVEQEGKVFVKIFNKGKHEQKLDAKTRALESAQVQVAEARSEAQEAARALAPAAAELQRLQQVAARRGQIVAEQEQILHNLFAGFAAGDERENAVEAHVAQLANLHNQIAAALRDQEIGLQHVAHAAELMNDMLRTLRSAAFSNTMDMFSDGIIGMVAGLQTNSALNKVRHQGRTAQQCLQQARRYSPFMPMVRDTSNMGWGGLTSFFNIAFDNVFQDIMQAAIISQQTSHIKRALQDVSYNLQWQQAFVQNIRRDLAANAQALEAARKQLVGERIRLVSSLAAAPAPGPAAPRGPGPAPSASTRGPALPPSASGRGTPPAPFSGSGVSRFGFPPGPAAPPPYNPFA